MLGVEDKPTQVDNMIMPPQAFGVKVISIGMFTPGNTPVVWRGPMLHRALQQFLADVWWGDLDVLLLDLPPDRKSTRLNSSHANISYAVFCLKKKKTQTHNHPLHPLYHPDFYNIYNVDQTAGLDLLRSVTVLAPHFSQQHFSFSILYLYHVRL